MKYDTGSSGKKLKFCSTVFPVIFVVSIFVTGSDTGHSAKIM